MQAGATGQFVDAPAPLGGVLAEQAGEELEVLEHRQGRVEVLAQPLRHVGDARTDVAAMAARGHVAIQHLHRAFLQLPGAGHQRQQAGLADTVRADQADHAAGRDLEADTVERAGLAVGQADAVQPGDACLSHWPTITFNCRSAGHWASGSSLR
ncbi:hypothetical protein D9M71_630930 [compost metagenome]